MSVGALAASAFFTVFIVAALIALKIEYSIPAPSGWPESVKLYKQPITESVRVVDATSDRTIFWYSESLPTRPVKVEKLVSGEWNVVFEELR